ncbi:3-oxoacyl-[acyl-carrier protein] reductase [Haloactinopolyspora alba]|uniref:3-oxoacyl-[acyl-carrier protein] reductase n=1 Tax=Haloactinopolyspora alba TaxID=648780 RepID=A0A2P8E9M7_9ACTN|nr:SDR family oxidoreductase [Haloactinopolyspora alba]PSL06127.1 3-oxoacyl-[acyl-carrier protein] reductase [Haloactinopolyspora alba]
MSGDVDASLAGRVVVVTGASGGIGRAITDLVSRDGAAVVMGCSGDDAWPEQLPDGAGTSTAVHRVDVRDPEQVDELMAFAGERFGGIDALVNSAGVMEQVDFEDLDPALWNEIITVNLTGAYLCVRAALPWLRRSAAPVVVNVASQLGYAGAARAVAYSASKAGLLGLTRALAHELGPGIRVNAVAPGPIRTPMTDPHATPEWVEQKTSRQVMKRFGEPHEVASAVRFLIGDESSYFTGQTLSPNGGGVMP